MKRHRPRNRNPYRDNVLTVPTTPNRFQLEERSIREAWNRNQPLLTRTREIILEPGEETQIEVDGIVHTITNTTGHRIKFSPNFDTDDNDKSKDN